MRWMTSFLSDRTLEVRYNGASTAAQPMYYGVPQGSVLGPILFNLYTADITLVAARHGLQLHQYADDCQLYVSAPVDEASATVSKLYHCVTDVASWLSASRLRLNPAKIVLMWLGSRQQVEKIGIREVPIYSSLITRWTQHETLASRWTVISPCQRMSAPCVDQRIVSCASFAQSYGR